MTSIDANDIPAHLGRVCDPVHRAYACRARTADGIAAWRGAARPALRERLGLTRMEQELSGHVPQVTCGRREAMDGYARTLCQVETEPGWRLPFWLFQPDGAGPFPVAITPHGHSPRGWHESAGVWEDEAQRDHIVSEDRDVAVQAVSRGFLAIAPATRGIATVGAIGDQGLIQRHPGRNCHAHAQFSLLAGRTLTGERVWDMMRLVDWALSRGDTDPSRILMMGNSGGGMVTTYAAACDARITVAVASCSFSPYIRDDGGIQHCDCNMVPGILRFGEFWDVAGLITPRSFLVVHGEQDKLFDRRDVDRAAQRAAGIFAAAGARFDCRFGPGGHRYYRDLLWPFIEAALPCGG